MSVYQEIKRKLPDQHYIYVFDNEAFPYGELDDDVLIERVSGIINTLCQQHEVSLIVIACNTASTIVLPILRKAHTIPIVGVVPAIKPAAALSKKKSIGVLATPATVSRDYTQSLINEFAPDCEVTLVGTTELVYMAENKIMGREISKVTLSQILQPFYQKTDCIVLGCTHFPLLKNEIQEILGKGYTVVDSGAAIARRVGELLNSVERIGDENFTAQSERPNIAYCSAYKDQIQQIEKELATAFDLKEIRRVPFF